MKAVQLLINSYLPAELRDYSRDFDVKGMGKLMVNIARDYPDRYEEISKKISDVGRNTSYSQGETLHMGDMLPVIDKHKVLAQMDAELSALKQEDPENYDKRRFEVWQRYADLIEKMTMKGALAKGNNLAYSVASGARGKPPQLRMMLSAPGLYTDYKDNPLPIFARSSFAEGLRPAEFLAGAFGARKAVIATKVSTAKGGDISKIMVQSAANLTVTSNDCGTANGIDLDADDPSLRGRVLAMDTAGIPAGTIIDKQVMAHLRKSKAKKVVARSAMTCSQHPGICSKCVGAFYDGGKLPKIGDSVGITAAQAIGEPITQGALNTKHQGGVASSKKTYGGFDVINQIVQSPENFPDRAAVSEVDGRVDSIEEAPQGGMFVTVGEEQHYVPQGYDVTVKVGDRVEAGDQLSDGIVDAGDIVRLRGLGEGRRFYSNRLKQALDDSGMGADIRNTEILARATIDHVTIDDPEGVGNYMPDDLVSYNQLQKTYNPPASTLRKRVQDAAGKFLQAPVLHYSIGTRVTPSVIKRLGDVGINDIHVSDEAPAIHSTMVRLRTAAHTNPDWLASMHTSYLKSQLTESAIRGDTTDTKENTHFAPRLAVGTDFGKNIETTGQF
jgi:DNA-directed RNA polymerase subunit beta'